MTRSGEVIGVLLAGGEGRRLGGDKAWVELAGRTLAERAIESLRAVSDCVVVSCRMGTTLPPLPGVDEAWVQREDGNGPVAGLAAALREARGRPILALALSLPLMRQDVLRALLDAPAEGRAAVLPWLDGRLEPLVGRWSPAALPMLEGFRASRDLDRVARCVDPAIVPFAPEDPAFLRVQRPEDVLRAHAILDSRPKRVSTLGACESPLSSSSPPS